jgi:hypothetical protein
MKKVIMTLALVGIVSSVATQAFAREYPVPPQQQRAERDMEYWQNKGYTSSGEVIKPNPDYEYVSATYGQRIAKKNAEYFEKIGYKSGVVEPFKYTDVSEYPLPGMVLTNRGGYQYRPGGSRR